MPFSLTGTGFMDKEVISTFSITVRDVVSLLALLLTVAGVYYSVDSRVGMAEYKIEQLTQALNKVADASQRLSSEMIEVRVRAEKLEARRERDER